jgi:hypothetical protein
MGIECILARVYFFECAVSLSLTREAGGAGGPSLRLKNGYAQDDNAIRAECRIKYK